MFSVTKTELNVVPVCTKNVCPTKSGVTIERRDQVLIGFFPPELFALSIFSRRCDSTKGPFFNDLDIKIKFNSESGNHESRKSILVLPVVPFAFSKKFRASWFLDYCFFLDFLRSKMKRSLGLCFVRVLNPLASCPHGLTG